MEELENISDLRKELYMWHLREVMLIPILVHPVDIPD